jgi:hypothetical protein
MQKSPGMTPENVLFDLFSGYMDIMSVQFESKERVTTKWDNFKRLIMSKPIDYHKVYSYISKLAEDEY